MKKKTSDSFIHIDPDDFEKSKYHGKCSRRSYEENIYEHIKDVEIAQYFYEDLKPKDDMNISRRSSRRIKSPNSRSVDKTKSNSDVIRKNSIINFDTDDDYFKNLNNSQKEDKIKDYISEYEKVIRKETAIFKFVDANSTLRLFSGTAILTDFRLKFYYDDPSDYLKVNLVKQFFFIPIFSIEKLEKSKEKKNSNQYNLNITTKDNRHVILTIINDQPQFFFFYYLKGLAFPTDIKVFTGFAFEFGRNYKKSSNEVNGWTRFNLIKELERQEVDYKSLKSRYRISKVNDGYHFSYSYPKYLVVPRFVSDQELIEASSFRTRARIPILSFQYKENKCCLWRTSQPKPGLTHQRNSADEKILKMVMDFSKNLIIYDARPYLNALANRLKGGGFELADNYYKTQIIFCEIENIHTLRSSLGKVYSLVNLQKLRENKKFHLELEKTGWMEFISSIIKFSVEMASSIKSGSTVLIHCSDGWDRSSQLAALSQLILDPYYRTLNGFAVLIEKDWLSFGHQFPYRNGNYVEDMGENQRSQVFLQWLDAVHQLLIQFPQAFEFNMDFLIFIANNITSCLYGTFLFNNNKEREECKAYEGTVSIWTDMLSAKNIDKYKNPFYLENVVKDLLEANYGYHKLRLWEEFFLQYEMTESVIKINRNAKNEEPLLIKGPHRYFEYSKKEDIMVIKKQKEKIEQLKNAIKDLTSLSDKNRIDQLNDSTKDYIEKLNKCQHLTEENELKVIPIVEDYINNK